MSSKDKAILDLISRFRYQVEKLKLFESSFRKLSMSLSLDESGQNISLEGISEADLPSVLMYFRTFYMESSDLSFPNIAKSLIESPLNLDHDLILKFLETWNKLVDKQRISSNGLTLNMNGSNLTARKNFDIWLNEGFFHSENYRPKTGKGLDGIKSHKMFEGVSEFAMQSLLSDLCILLLCFDAQVVENIINPHLSD